MYTLFTLRTVQNRFLVAVVRGKHIRDYHRLHTKSIWLNRIWHQNREFRFSINTLEFLGLTWEFTDGAYTYARSEGPPPIKRPWQARFMCIESIDCYGVFDCESIEEAPFKTGVYDLGTAHAQAAYERVVTEGGHRFLRFTLHIEYGTMADRAALYERIMAGLAVSRRTFGWPIEWIEADFRGRPLVVLKRLVENYNIPMPTDRELTEQDYIDALVDACWDKWEVEEARAAGRVSQ